MGNHSFSNSEENAANSLKEQWLILLIHEANQLSESAQLAKIYGIPTLLHDTKLYSAQHMEINLR